MKTIIFTLAIFALLVLPGTCKKEESNLSNTSNSEANESFSSKEEEDPTLIIDPTKPIPKP